QVYAAGRAGKHINCRSKKCTRSTKQRSANPYCWQISYDNKEKPMKQQAPFILPTTLSRNSSTRSLLRRQFCLVALGCFGLLSAAVAVNLPPDGGYTYGNHAVGTDAIYIL